MNIERCSPSHKSRGWTLCCRSEGTTRGFLGGERFRRRLCLLTIKLPLGAGPAATWTRPHRPIIQSWWQFRFMVPLLLLVWMPTNKLANYRLSLCQRDNKPTLNVFCRQRRDQARWKCESRTWTCQPLAWENVGSLLIYLQDHKLIQTLINRYESNMGVLGVDGWKIHEAGSFYSNPLEVFNPFSPTTYHPSQRFSFFRKDFPHWWLVVPQSWNRTRRDCRDWSLALPTERASQGEPVIGRWTY